MNYTVGLCSQFPIDIAKGLAYDNYKDYVFFFSSNFDWYFISGDIDFDTLSFTDCSVTRIHSINSMDMSDAIFQVFDEGVQSGSLSVSTSAMYFSSSDSRPSLVPRGGDYLAACILLSVTVGVCLFLFSDIFRSVSRK